MIGFKTYHPIVNFIYFVFVIGFSCFFMHPVCLGISLLSGFVYSVRLSGGRQIKISALYLVPMVCLSALINAAFNHAGETIITYFPNGNPLTLQSVLYGLCQGVMLSGVIFHFSVYNEVMTSDKFLYLFGKIVPGLALVISMTLRFVPNFISHLKVVRNAQKCLGRDGSGSLVKRAKHGLSVLSVMTTWALENAIETADSMKGRGYGLRGRTAFSVFAFQKKDKKALFCILFLGVYTLMGAIRGEMQFDYFPHLSGGSISPYTVSVFLSYLALCISPVFIELWEVRKWRA